MQHIDEGWVMIMIRQVKAHIRLLCASLDNEPTGDRLPRVPVTRAGAWAGAATHARLSGLGGASDPFSTATVASTVRTSARRATTLPRVNADRFTVSTTRLAPPWAFRSLGRACVHLYT